MRVLILGATGGIGLLLIERALAASHTVVVYARSPEKLPEQYSNNPNVVIRKGELTDEATLTQALDGVDAVLSALGPSVSRGPLHPSGEPLAHAYALLIRVMKQKGVPRLIALGTPSITDPADKFSLKMSAIVTGVATFARTAYKDVVAIGNTIREDGGNHLDWTIGRVPILTSSQSEEYIAGYVGDGKTGIYLSRNAFATFVLDELERDDWVHKAPLISSA